MKYQDATISNSGIKLGDFVLMNKANGYYGMVAKINKRFYENSDWHVRYGQRYRRVGGKKQAVAAGQETTSTLTVIKIINLDLTQPKRKLTSSIDDDKVIVISKEFISKMFKTLNDTLAFVKMTNEQQGIK